jgi:hypothetical protein
MAEKNFNQVCKCENCGSEAEMTITCSLVEEQAGDKKPKPKVVSKEEGKTEGHAVCSHCGGEADIWLDA